MNSSKNRIKENKSKENENKNKKNKKLSLLLAILTIEVIKQSIFSERT